MSLGTGPSQFCWRSTDGAFAAAGLARVLVTDLAVVVGGGVLRVASHADTPSGVARSRAAMASMSASARTRSRSCLARAAMVSGLDVGRPLKVVLFPWTLVGRAGVVGAVGLAGRAG